MGRAGQPRGPRGETSHASEEQLRDLLRAVAHDLNAPLSAIRLHADLLQRHRHEDDPVARRGRIISRNVERAAAQLRELVELTTLEETGLALRPVDVASFLAELPAALEGVVDPARVRVEVAPGVPPVAAEPVRLERIVVNLLVNATKYAARGTPILVRASAAGERVAIEVVDQGPGISKEALPHIFERFYRAPEATPRGGRGLGLFISRRLAEAHGGSLTASSGAGAGSTFRLELPAWTAP